MQESAQEMHSESDRQYVSGGGAGQGPSQGLLLGILSTKGVTSLVYRLPCCPLVTGPFISKRC